jgi:uroporphyrinogen decarboxylase
MTNREIVIRALSKDNPVKVPKDMEFTSFVEQKLKEKIGNVDLRDYFKMEMRSIDINPTKKKTDFSKYLPDNLPEGTYIDSDGIARVPGSMYHFTRKIGPLERLSDLKELKEFPFSDEMADYRYDGLKERVDKLHKQGYFVSGDKGNLLELAWSLRGMDNFLVDLVSNDELVEYLLDRITEMKEFKVEMFAKAGCDQIMFSEDLGMQDRMIMSPDTWRKWFKPRWKRIIAKAKSINPNIFIWFHSDGDIREVIPDFIEIGVNVLNPVQPECIDPAEIRKLYGDKLAFWGTIGTQTTMPFGTPEDVKNEVKKRIETVGYDGGLVLAPTHTLEPEVPMENIFAFFEAVEEFKYKF